MTTDNTPMTTDPNDVTTRLRTLVDRLDVLNQDVKTGLAQWNAPRHGTPVPEGLRTLLDERWILLGRLGGVLDDVFGPDAPEDARIP